MSPREFDPVGPSSDGQLPPVLDFQPPKRINRRHERRSEPAAFRIRVELIDSEPVVWRSLDIRSDTLLPRVHMFLQAAIGWENVHLHEFVHAPDAYQRDAERFVSFDIPDAEEFGALDENEVRLDELLGDEGDQFVYSYDFGDGWDHLVTLEAISKIPEGGDAEADDAAETASAADARGRLAKENSAVIEGGSILCPPEDSGGIPTYNEAMALIREREQQLGKVGIEDDAVAMVVAAYMFAPTEIDLQRVQRALNSVGSMPATLDEVFAEQAARLDIFLELVGDEVTLTKAGWLPPKIVRELMTKTDLISAWRGPCNREFDTFPASEIREWALALKLVRKYKGTLRPTRFGASLRGDRDSIARLVEERLPFERMYRTVFIPVPAGRATTRYQQAAEP